MVRSREELLQVAGSNANQLKAHLRQAVQNFLAAQEVSEDELAYVLGITGDEMNQILHGNGNVTVDVLSKLLVATDMAVEIKSVRNTPLGGYGRKMPKSGGFPSPNGMRVNEQGIPCDEYGRPLPPPPGMPGFMGGMPPREERAANLQQEIPMETTGPVRDSHGRFVKKAKNATRPVRPAQPQMEEGNPYLNISKADLANIVRQNIWDGEIDVVNASQQELAAFVANKERIMRQRASQAEQEQAEPQPQPRPQGGMSGSANAFIQMLENMAQEAKNNPQLAETIARFMPK
jgi:predicted XRE-type DNA-binding protein